MLKFLLGRNLKSDNGAFFGWESMIHSNVAQAIGCHSQLKAALLSYGC